MNAEPQLPDIEDGPPMTLGGVVIAPLVWVFIVAAIIAWNW